MNRFALIIGSPGKIGTDGYLTGVPNDIKNYTEYLQSPMGGAWQAKEITQLQDPTVLQVNQALSTARLADYAFIVFSGHGYYSAEKESTILQVNTSETINENELRKGFRKQTVILDCCRKKVATQIMEKRALAYDAAPPKFNLADCRRYFDEAIQACPDTYMLIHACSIDEYSYDDDSGGIYSFSIIDQSRKWANRSGVDTSKSYRIGSVVEMHDLALRAVKTRTVDKQNPKLERARIDKSFPFCIVA